ncbi:SRPBCC family protein [Streptosporangium sp. NPDC002607]
MIDVIAQINAIHREVGSRSTDSGESIGLLLRRGYDAPIQDVWEALTDPDRMKRWFLPVSGELRVGGTFQLEGNAGGRILHCEPPRLLRVTFGGETSVVELRLSPDGEGTTLELEHTVPLEMAGSGAGALYVGPGWDGALMALDLFVAGEVGHDPVAAANSPEGQEFSRQSVHAWTATVEASGTAGSAEIAAAVDASLAQFAPDIDSAPDQNRNI